MIFDTGCYGTEPGFFLIKEQQTKIPVRMSAILQSVAKGVISKLHPRCRDAISRFNKSVRAGNFGSEWTRSSSQRTAATSMSLTTGLLLSATLLSLFDQLRDGRDKKLGLLCDNSEAKASAESGVGTSNDKHLNEYLSWASFAGNLQVVKDLIRRGANPNSRREGSGDTVLHRAVRGRNFEVVKYLLEEALADPNATSFRGWTPLHIAAEMKCVGISRLLIQHGANPNVQTNSQATPLHLACQGGGHADLVRVLLECSQFETDTNLRDARHRTPLTYANLNADTESLRVLIAHGADLDSSTSDAWRDVSEARERFRTTHVLMELHGWRPIIQAVLEDTEKLIETGEPRATAEAIYRKRRLEKLRKELHTIDVRLKTTKNSIEQRQLLFAAQKLRKKVALLCQSVDVQLEQRNQRKSAPVVFLSHTGQEVFSPIFAEVVWEKLGKESDVDSFLDSDRLEAGHEWIQDIEYCATGCRVFVCILSREYFRRYWCMHELDLALQSGKSIIPVSNDRQVFSNINFDDVRQALSAQLAEKHDGNVDPEILDRWCGNIEKLKKIQCEYPRKAPKHNFLSFRNDVVTLIVKKLETRT